jgi:hypothetical protein
MLSTEVWWKDMLLRFP